MTILGEKLLYISAQETLIVWQHVPRDLVISMADDDGRKISRFGIVGLAEGALDMVSIRNCLTLPG